MPSTGAGITASKTVSPPPKSKSVVAGLRKPGSKKTKSPTQIPDLEMPDIAATAGEETEDSDTVVVPRIPRARGKPAVARSNGTISPPPGGEGAKVVIRDEITSASPPPPLPSRDTNSEDEPPKKEVAKPLPAPVKKISRIGKIGGKKAAKKEHDDDAEMNDIVSKPELSTPSSSTSVCTVLPRLAEAGA